MGKRGESKEERERRGSRGIELMLRKMKRG